MSVVPATVARHKLIRTAFLAVVVLPAAFLAACAPTPPPPPTPVYVAPAPMPMTTVPAARG